MCLISNSLPTELRKPKTVYVHRQVTTSGILLSPYYCMVWKLKQPEKEFGSAPENINGSLNGKEYKYIYGEGWFHVCTSKTAARKMFGNSAKVYEAEAFGKFVTGIHSTSGKNGCACCTELTLLRKVTL